MATKHTLIVIGGDTDKHVFLDVPRDAALKRWCKLEGIPFTNEKRLIADEGITIEQLGVNDHFRASHVTTLK